MNDKRKKLIKYILLFILLLIVIIAIWIFRPPSHYNKSKVDARLTSLEEPFKKVSAGYYMDGGSVAIHIIDKNDKPLKIAIPVIDFDRSYNRIYFGVSHYNEVKDDSAKAQNSLETKLMIEDILHRYSNQDPYIDVALSAIRGRIRDYIKVIYHNRMGHYEFKNSEE